MKFIVSTVLTAALSYVAGVLELPWWCIAICAFLIAFLIHQKPAKAFASGFLALFILWGGMVWVIDRNNEHILSTKVGELFKLSGNLLMLITAIIGGLVAGFAALTGSLLRVVRK